MSRRPDERRRVKVSVAVDPALLKAVDRFVDAHPGLHRSKVFDDALYHWYARQQAEAMAAQFNAPESKAEQEEQDAWHDVRRAAAERRFPSRWY